MQKLKIKNQNYKKHKVAKAQRRTKTLCLSASVPAAFSLILHFNFYLAFEL